MGDKERKGKELIAHRALKGGVTEELVTLTLGMTTTMFRWLRLTQTLDQHDPFRARASLQSLLIVNNLLQIIHDSRPMRASAVKRKEMKSYYNSGMDRGSGTRAKGVNTVRMAKLTLEKVISRTISEATALTFHAPPDEVRALNDEIRAMIAEVTQGDDVNEHILRVEAVLRNIQEELTQSLNEYYGNLLQAEYNPTEQEGFGITQGMIEHWDTVEDEIVELEQAFKAFDDWMKQNDIKKYDMEDKKYFDNLAQLLGQEPVQNLDPYARGWIRRRPQKKRRGIHNNNAEARELTEEEELAFLRARYGDDFDDDDAEDYFGGEGKEDE